MKHYQKEHPTKLICIFERKFVLDCTSFKDDHPGGSAVLEEFAGGDLTEAFVQQGHTDDARKTALSLSIGEIETYHQGAPTAAVASSNSAGAVAAVSAGEMSEEERQRRIKEAKPSWMWDYVPTVVGLLVGTVVYVAVRELRASRRRGA